MLLFCKLILNVTYRYFHLYSPITESSFSKTAPKSMILSSYLFQKSDHKSIFQTKILCIATNKKENYKKYILHNQFKA